MRKIRITVKSLSDAFAEGIASASISHVNAGVKPLSTSGPRPSPSIRPASRAGGGRKQHEPEPVADVRGTQGPHGRDA